MTKSTKALIALALLSACGGGPDPEPEPQPCESLCDGSTITICDEGDGTITIDCPGPDGCGGEDPFFTCDPWPRITAPCTEQQWWDGLTWCVHNFSWPDMIVSCVRVTGQDPRWEPSETCAIGEACVMSDGAPACVSM